jgi:hypothetical protein
MCRLGRARRARGRLSAFTQGPSASPCVVRLHAAITTAGQKHREMVHQHRPEGRCRQTASQSAPPCAMCAAGSAPSRQTCHTVRHQMLQWTPPALAAGPLLNTPRRSLTRRQHTCALHSCTAEAPNPARRRALHSWSLPSQRQRRLGQPRRQPALRRHPSAGPSQHRHHRHHHLQLPEWSPEPSAALPAR